MTTINIGKVSIELADYAVGASAVLGIRDSGKTVTSKGIAEQLLDHNVPIIVFDAVGKWQWMKVAAETSRGKAYEIVVAGGRKPDLPLTPHSVPEIVRSALKERIPLIIDLFSKELSKADWRRIVQTAIHIIHYENEGGAVHVFLEEAAEFCLAPDTEILTSVGWCKISDSQIGQMAACYDVKTGEYSFAPIARVLRKHYDGGMVHVKTRSVDCLMTEDHQAVIQRFQHSPSRYKIYQPDFCKASNLPMAFTIPNGGAPCGDGIEISHDMLSVIGWVATDGSLHSRGRNYITISQSDATVKRGVQIVSRMRLILTALGASEHRRRPRISRFDRNRKIATRSASSDFFLRKQLSDLIEQWMGPLIHRIPRKIIEGASRVQLGVLFQAMLEGDGTGNDRRWRCFYPGLDEGLADDFQEIATKLGIGTVKTFYRGQWRVSISERRERHWIQKFKPWHQSYSGEVVCVTVPTSAFVARRNGTVFVTGNCPQKIYDGETYAEVEKLVRMGGNASVGITLINQRSQEINKAVLDNCSTALILGCQVGKNAIEAVEKWIERLDPKTADELTESLPKLQAGEAWVWTRKSLDRPSREKIQMCRSFHPDRKTPEIVLKSVKPVNTDEFVSRLANSIPKVIEEAKANDPAQLKRTISTLRRELTQVQKAQPVVSKAAVKMEKVPALTDHDRKRLTSLIDSYERLESACDRIETMAAEIKTQAFTNRAEVTFFKTMLSEKLSVPLPTLARGPAIPRSVTPTPRVPIQRTAAPKESSNGEFALTPVQRRILNAAAELHNININPVPKDMLAVHAEQRPTSSGYFNNLGALRSAGMIEYPRPGFVCLTTEGEKESQPRESGTLKDFQKKWTNLMTPAQARIVKQLIAIYPQEIDKDALADLSDQRSTSSGYFNNLGALRTMGAIIYPKPGFAKASENIFPAGLL